ncbi:MAG: D-glycero-beta-D-manno-heptose 1-phosphate adenylyltransferase [Saprospiraceae bacterium]|nr:D-glycero-beta-D-manno-heptose 1-phosphate adenylyltransferase [Saprospiraceae bacterium]
MLNRQLKDKVVSQWDEGISLIRQWQSEGKKIVFTNGCFDLLHIGHVMYLEEAKSLGDVLVVGVNSDASVQRLKGPHRPIKDEFNRLHILAALESVDLVILFDSDDPYELIKSVKPDVLVKGGDWKPEEIIGSDIVLARGGEVKSLQFLEGYSTTLLEQKIKNTP